MICVRWPMQITERKWTCWHELRSSNPTKTVCGKIVGPERQESQRNFAGCVRCRTIERDHAALVSHAT